MAQNDPNQISMEQIKAIATSPVGKKLMAMVQKSNPKELQAARESAQKGDMAGAKESLSALLQDPNIQELLKQLGM